MSIWHLILLLIVVALIFGTGKLSSIGPDLGAAIRGFKKNLNGEDGSIPDAPNKLRADVPSSESGVRQDQSERASKP